MAEKQGKYAAALAAISKPEPKAPAVFLPDKQPVLTGKRSTPGWKAKQVLLKEETIALATHPLKYLVLSTPNSRAVHERQES